MTTLLLDTHAWVWAVTDPDRLPPAARTAMANPFNVLLVSAASVWEMAIKHRAGRWPEAEALLDQHGQLTEDLGAQDRPITAADAVRAGGLAWEHRDPFDRMLAAQAFLSTAVLVTRDTVFADLAGLPTLWRL